MAHREEGPARHEFRFADRVSDLVDRSPAVVAVVGDYFQWFTCLIGTWCGL